MSASGAALPVTGLDFTARRLNDQKVQLDWKTVQEYNNKGFVIERRQENQQDFNPVAFIQSLALNGNSSLSLQYQYVDDNRFAGKTYYRLKQQDLDGKIAYSHTRIVNGSGARQTVLQVWPVPSAGPVNVMVQGMAEQDILLVYDMTGKLLQRLEIKNNTAVKLGGLPRGSYLLRLASEKDISGKFVIQ